MFKSAILFCKQLYQRKWIRIVLKTIGIILIAHWLYVFLLIFMRPIITSTQIQSYFAGTGIYQNYRTMDQISDHAKLAVISAEDQLFPDHEGFDFDAIQKAWESNEKKTKRKRGASTISQQLAKNLFLWQGRSWFRKGLEVYFTFLIETFWSKRRILELYLNEVEMGKGIFGIDAAAKHYFGKSAQQLSRYEAASIAACLPNPKKYNAGRPSPYVQRRINWIMIQMNQLDGEEEIIKLMK